MSSVIACRSCREHDLKMVLSLGRMPLANALLTAKELEEQEPTYPLELVFCRNCSLVQITETVPPEQLFRDYPYFSSFSDTMLRHAQAIVERVVETRSINTKGLAVEIASNDGYLLQYYKQAGIPVLGIEPALNVARVAERERGIRTLTDFFGVETAERLVASGEHADVIHANNVLAHVPDLNGFVHGLRLLLKPTGVAIIEVPYLKDLVDRCEFDTIYHEHLSYFSLTALTHLFGRHGLTIREVETLPIHGGSLRIFVEIDNNQPTSKNVTEMLNEEERCGINRIEFYEDFARRVAQLKTSLREVMLGLKEKNERLAAYGAAAKGSTLLNYFEIGASIIDFVVDRSTYKQGHYMPGVRLPISAPARLLEEMPAYVLLLTWNFADEILAQQGEYRRRGGKFIIPIPQVRVV
jgi:SAM-dependent methyltransferase